MLGTWNKVMFDRACQKVVLDSRKMKKNYSRSCWTTLACKTVLLCQYPWLPDCHWHSLAAIEYGEKLGSKAHELYHTSVRSLLYFSNRQCICSLQSLQICVCPMLDSHGSSQLFDEISIWNQDSWVGILGSRAPKVSVTLRIMLTWTGLGVQMPDGS